MVVEAAVKQLVRRVVNILREYANVQGWKAEDYHIYVRPNLDWWYINLLLVAKGFPKQTSLPTTSPLRISSTPGGRTMPTGPGSDLCLETFDQVAQGGTYAIPETYFDGDDF